MLPVTLEFAALFLSEHHGVDININDQATVNKQGFEAVYVFHNIQFRIDVVTDDDCARKQVLSPQNRLHKHLQRLSCQRGIDWSDSLAANVPEKWEKHGDMVLLPASSFTDESWLDFGL